MSEQSNAAAEMPEVSPEQAQELAQLREHFTRVKKHLKTRSKNELVHTVLQLMGALVEANKVNKLINDELKNQLKKEESPSAENSSPNLNPA